MVISELARWKNLFISYYICWTPIMFSGIVLDAGNTMVGTKSLACLGFWCRRAPSQEYSSVKTQRREEPWMKDFPEAGSLKLSRESFCVLDGRGERDRCWQTWNPREEITDEAKFFRWQMESLSLVNMMSLGNEKQRLEENKERWERYREKLRKLPLDVFSFLSQAKGGASTLDDEREGLDWVVEEWQVRENRCEEGA